MGKKELGLLIFFLNLFFLFLFPQLPEEFLYPFSFLLLGLLTILLFRKSGLFLPKIFSLLFLFYFSSFFLSFPSLTYQGMLEILKTAVFFLETVVWLNLFRQKPRQFFFFFFSLLFLAAFLALAGIVEFANRAFSQKDLPLIFPFFWPSLSASFFLLIFPLVFFFFWESYSRPVKTLLLTNGRKILSFLFLYLLISAWILTKTYLFFLFALIFFLLFFSFRKFPPQTFRPIFFPLFLVFFLTLATLPHLFFSFGHLKIPREVRLFQAKFFFEKSDDLWRFFWQGEKKELLFGRGIKSLASAYKNNLAKPWVWSETSSFPFLLALIERGIVGFSLEAAFFLYLCLLTGRKAKESFQKNSFFSFVLSLALFFFLIASLSNFSFQIFPLATLFFFFFAFLLLEEKAFFLKPKLLFFFAPFLFFSFCLFSEAVLLRIGQKLFFQKNYQSSEKIFAFLGQRPSLFLNPKSLLWLAAVKLEKGEKEESRKILERVKIFSPENSAEIDFQLASFLFEEGKIKEAKIILEKNLQKNPFLSPKYYLARAKIALREEKKGEAEKWLTKALFFYPFSSSSSLSKSALAILETNGMLSSLQEIYFRLFELTGQEKYLTVLTQIIL